MARAAVIPQSPATRGTRTGPRAAPTKAATSNARVTANAKTRVTKKTAITAPNTAHISDSDTDDELALFTAPQHDDKPVKSRGRPASRAAPKSTTKVTGRGRKTNAQSPQESNAETEETGAELLQQSEAPKKRAGRPRKKTPPAEAVNTTSETAPKTRGRPKAATTAKASQFSGTTAVATRKKTRTATEAEEAAENAKPKQIVVATNSTTMRSNMLRGPAKKKTVTFQDVSDSESDESSAPAVPAAGRRRAATKGANGLGATPVRKPATAGGRGRKPAATKKDAAQPLSPKKAKQMAKSLSAYASSDGEEDELSAAKDDLKRDVKLVVHSPVKHGSDNPGLSSPVRRVNFTPKKASSLIDENGEPKLPTPKHGSETTGLSSPVRKINFTPNCSQHAAADNDHLALPPGKSIDFSDSLFMSSPARRPAPSSPFQFSLRDTPNRGGSMFREDSNPIPAPNFTPGRSSPLKSSPKKGHLGASFSQSPFKTSTPSIPNKTSFIQSPAKKMPSPFKSSIFSNPAPVTESTPSVHNETPCSIHEHEQNNQGSLLNGEDVEETAVDTDLEMVEEVARDIFGIELQSDPKPSSESPHHKDIQDLEEAPEPQLTVDFYDEIPQLDDEKGSLPEEETDEETEDPQEQAHFELEDQETLCFDGMEEFQGLSDHFHQQVLDLNTAVAQAEPIDETATASEQPDIEELAPPGSDIILNSTEEADSAQTPEPEKQENAIEIQPLADPVSPVESTVELSDVEETEGTTIVRQLSEGDAQEEDLQGDQDDHVYIDDLAQNPDEEQQGVLSEKSEAEDDEPTLVTSETTINVIPQSVSPDEISEGEDFTSPLRRMQAVPPPVPTPPTEGTTPSSPHHEEDTATDHEVLQDEEPIDFTVDMNMDEQSSPSKTAETEVSTPAAHSISHTPSTTGQRNPIFDVDLGFTPLVHKFGRWEPNTPSEARPARPRRRGVFSLVGPLERATKESTPESAPVSYPDLSRHSLANTPSLFAELPLPPQSDDTCMISEYDQAPESPAVHEDSEMPDSPSKTSDIFEDPDCGAIAVDVDQTTAHEDVSVADPSEALQQHSYPDEDKENCDIPVLLPATPVKSVPEDLRTVHTVFKVPLKAEGDVSPLKLPRKRGLSLSGASPTRSSPRVRKSIFLPGNDAPPALSPPWKSPRVERSPSPKRRNSTARRSSGQASNMGTPRAHSTAGSPAKTPRRDLGGGPPVLRGAVVHVDVHTTEGEDASGIFVELLQQMGARCVKGWSWNPRSSLSPVDGAEPKEAKVGITHVVYKDGGLRTLEKVKHAAGLVKCVGVGWVLDCERESQWLDETPYEVDSSIIPRGGAKRRKSMEPRALSNVNGTLVRVPEPSTPSASRRRSGADRGAVEGFRKITPPTPQPEGPSTPTRQSSTTNNSYFPATPGYNFANLDAIGMSPATPFFLSNRSRLIQQSCPPKQSGQGLFPGARSSCSLDNENDDDDAQRQRRFRSEAARRKSHAFKPTVASRLAR
ncbi:hypothetical protein NUU61_005340 [Penicillium alfredii]|uniref:BRCT domain-containing protein n=1 Tax=Penicillium alfredii TaxID=1506179 RepID=A0A9W9K7H9_9EURO|nr:uncharacterized protein NUU61_005340 [Penicillium alfredii]KAJ5095984.1 hypothetical protein NUU61_005340 [Penicillium alfredii]